MHVFCLTIDVLDDCDDLWGSLIHISYAVTKHICEQHARDVRPTTVDDT